jgi:hypothetical protein
MDAWVVIGAGVLFALFFFCGMVAVLFALHGESFTLEHDRIRVTVRPPVPTATLSPLGEETARILKPNVVGPPPPLVKKPNGDIRRNRIRELIAHTQSAS